MMNRLVRFCLWTLTFHLMIPACHAQWLTRTIEIHEGWNAVFLDVQPYPRETSLQFSGLPVNRVWTYDPQFSPEQFITDPDEFLPESPKWRAYFPEDSPESFATDLFTLQSGKPYLINASESFTWTFKGNPRLDEYNWTPNSYNLVGFHISSSDPPTFGEWFEASSAHLPLDIWKLNPDGVWEQISSPVTESIRPNVAYWVYTKGSSDYQGPLRVTLPQPEVLEFPEKDVESEFDIQPVGSGDRTVTVTLAPSEPVPDLVEGAESSDVLPNAGDVVVTCKKKMDSGPLLFDYVDFPVQVEFTDGDRRPRKLELAIERNRMDPSPSENAVYQGILIVRDDRGTLWRIPVTAEGQGTSTLVKRYKKLKGTEDKGVPARSDSGLWFGTVTVNKVSEPRIQFSDPEIRSGTRLPNIGSEELTPTAVEFNFPILIHVDAVGTVRLLSEVTQLWRNGITRPDPNVLGGQVIVEEGRGVLMTADAPQELLDELGDRLVGGTLRDGRSFANRITSPMFSLRNADGNPESPVMNSTGNLLDDGTVISISVVLEDTDPLNPFHHQFHPAHRYPEPGEVLVAHNVYEIRREISLTFLDEPPPDGRLTIGLGDTQVCGVYREGIEGLRNDRIFVEGYFRLYRISRITVLNDGLGFAN